MWFFQSGITLENAIVRIIASLAIIFLVMPFHEFAHGFVANLCGDNTAKLTGRLSMNPLNNVDPLGAAAILFLGMGWAKPVPVNVYNFKNKRLGTFLTYFAGPVLNILAAILAGLIFNTFLHFSYSFSKNLLNVILLFLYYFMQISIGIATFNLVPLPGLDGFFMLSAFVPDKLLMKFYRYQHYIMFGVVLLVFAGFLSAPLSMIDYYIYRGIIHFTAIPFGTTGI